MSYYWLIADADKIQSYLFEAVRLKEIMGASLLLRRFNEDVRELSREDDELIISDGGSVKLKLNSRERAVELISKISTLYLRHTKTATISFSDPLEVADDNQFPAVALATEKSLRHNKNSGKQARPLISSPYLSWCENCGLRPAIRREPVEGGTSLLCQTCLAKRYTRIKEGNLFFDEIEAELQKIHGKPHLLPNGPEDFNEIGKKSHPRGYSGLIVADGNNMGEKFAQCQTPQEYDALSKKITNTTNLALREAIIAAFGLEDAAKLDKYTTEYLPLQVLVNGGDDLVVLTTADTALPIAAHFCRRFHELSDGEFSMSAGVTLTKDNLPFLISYRLANELLKSAKKLAKKQGGERGAIDFQVVTASNSLTLKEIRREITYLEPQKDEEQAERLIFTARPYTTETVANAVDIEDLIKGIKKLKEAGMTRSQLANFYELLNANNVARTASDFGVALKYVGGEYQRQVRRLEKPAQAAWRELETLNGKLGSFNKFYAERATSNPKEYIVLSADIIELYEFVKA